jgi:hypothetical protein
MIILSDKHCEEIYMKEKQNMLKKKNAYHEVI